MQSVTLCYKRGYRIVGKKAGGRSRYLKRVAHRRRRGAEREWLGRQRWDAEVLEARPVTSWDVC
jgi:hypothetical protein